VVALVAVPAVDERSIVCKVDDDRYDPSKTVPLAQQLVEQGKVFATLNSIGTEQAPAARSCLNSAGVPELLGPLYVSPTSGTEAALGAYRRVICLPPADVPVGTPGRSGFGAQVLDASVTVPR